MTDLDDMAARIESALHENGRKFVTKKIRMKTFFRVRDGLNDTAIGLGIMDRVRTLSGIRIYGPAQY